MTKRSSAPARVLAVLALIGGFVLVVVIISAALEAATRATAGRTARERGDVERREKKDAPAVYVVENGDTLTSIAHETGVPVADDRASSTPTSTRRS